MEPGHQSLILQRGSFLEFYAPQTDTRGRNHVRTTDVVGEITIEDDRPQVSDGSISNPNQSRASKCRSKFTGWRVGALIAAALTSICLIVNVVATVWLFTRATYDEGLAVLYHGDCGRVKPINIAGHLLINILSTMLLGASNYCMQCLVAPTRDMINKAHRRGEWLDIGISSIRNLCSAPSLHVILWFLLLVSSLPLHLMYNSAIYPSITVYDYKVSVLGSNSDGLPNMKNATYDNLLDRRLWNNLTNAECIRAYGKQLIADRGNVVVVASARFIGRNFDEPYVRPMDPPWWVCSDERAAINDPQLKTYFTSFYSDCPSQVLSLVTTPNTWAPFGIPASYCLSERVTQLCGLHANLPILITIIICNAIKCSITLYVAFFLRGNPLVIIGDAIQSFLLERDKTTYLAGLMCRYDVIQSTRQGMRSFPTHQRKSALISGTKHKIRYPRRWRATGRTPWGFTILSFCLTIDVSLGLLAYGITKQFPKASIKYLWNLGYGEVNSVSIISSGTFHSEKFLNSNNRSVIAAILTANAPQLLLSILYFTLNGLMTNSCLVIEWAKFSTQRGILRVSNPRAGQKSSYFLTIPYRYAVPLLVAFVLLHWSTSQSIFLAVIKKAETNGTGQSYIAITCGYSPIAIVTTAILGSIVLLVMIVIGLQRVKAGIPLAGSCSAAISAACHPPKTESDTSLKPIQWGVVPGMMNGSQEKHCALSSGKIGHFDPHGQYW